MPVRAFKKVESTTPGLNKVQQNVEEFVTQFFRNPTLNGILLKEINLLSASTNNIEHDLGREVLGWIVVRKRADSRIWDSQDSQTFKQRFLSLDCSADVTVDLWVF